MKTRVQDALVVLSAGLSLSAAVGLSGCEPGPKHAAQAGFRGVGMMQVSDPARASRLAALNVPPPPLPKADTSSGGPLAGDTLRNVQVLKDVPVAEFTRLMAAVTSWVAPQQGCPYCHDPADLSADDLYTKVVARRMFAMTRHINSEWHAHVSATGVTCYTCHRGHNVPAQIWFSSSGLPEGAPYAGNKVGQNAPADSVRLAALPATLSIDTVLPLPAPLSFPQPSSLVSSLSARSVFSMIGQTLLFFSAYSRRK